MKNIVIAIFSIVLFSGRLCLAVDTTALNEEKDRVSYSVGYQIGEDLRQQKIEFDPAAFLKGVEDALSEMKPELSAEEMNAKLVELKKKLEADYKTKQSDKRKDLQDTKEKYWGEGREFLAENKKKEGVVELPSGLQYKVITEGAGKKPGPGDAVLVQYRGTLIDGTEFDSSYRNNKPSKFHVSGVIPGWKEALQMMKEGATWRIFVPADLAYGERGPLADRTVIFDIELISVESSK